MGVGGIVHAMPDFLKALQSGSTSLWLFIPTAILLGALHGLEPGHSKTMMAAFIVAIRGTVGQAVLLGLSAAISHSLLIWLLAALALYFGSQWNAEAVEPYLQIASAVIIFALAVWMFLRTRRDLRDAAAHTHGHEHHGHEHDEHGHGHEHAHSELFILNTSHGKVELSVFEEGVPPVFRLRPQPGATLPLTSLVKIETVRPNGSCQTFSFEQREDCLQSREDIPEPHEFDAKLILKHTDYTDRCHVEFREDAHHHHHDIAGDEDFEDAHQREHAADIVKRFAGRPITTPQIVLFGVTGGLMPCPAAFTVLLVCLQLKRVALGFAMVGAFSFGLALTMVATGTLAALSVRHAEKRFRGFGEAMRRAPYISCVLLVVLAAYMAWHGCHGLALHS